MILRRRPTKVNHRPSISGIPTDLQTSLLRVYRILGTSLPRTTARFRYSRRFPGWYKGLRDVPLMQAESITRIGIAVVQMLIRGR